MASIPVFIWGLMTSNEMFWETLGSFREMAKWELVCKECRISPTQKPLVILWISQAIPKLKKKMFVDWFKLTEKDFRGIPMSYSEHRGRMGRYTIAWLSSSVGFEAVFKRYGRSWSAVQEGILSREQQIQKRSTAIRERYEQQQQVRRRQEDHRRGRLLAALEPHGIQELHGTLALSYVRNHSIVSLDKLAFEIARRRFYHNHTNYDQLTEHFTDLFGFPPGLHATMRNFMQTHLPLPEPWPWLDPSTKQQYTLTFSDLLLFLDNFDL